MSLQDFQKPIDPTFSDSITGAQLAQLFDGLTVFADKGLIIETTDNGVHAVAPNATITPRYKRYLWRRVNASGVTFYQWNDNIISDPETLKWQSLIQLNVPANSVGTTQIINGAVTDAKISTVSYGKIIGVPASLPPSGAAGGSLGGNYPNPTLNPPNNSFPVAGLTIPPAVPGYSLRIKTDASVPEFAGFGIIQYAAKKVNGQVTSNSVVTDGAPTSGQGTSIALINFSPISASSLIKIRLVGEMFASAAHNANFGIFQNGTLLGLAIVSNGGGYPGAQSSIEVVMASWGAGVAQVIEARLGTTVDASQTAKFGVANGNVLSILSVEEIFGTLT